MTVPMDVSSTFAGATPMSTAPPAIEPAANAQPCPKAVACIEVGKVAHDWQGRLAVNCQACYVARPGADIRDLREWKKLCKTRSAARSMANGMDLRRARTSGWDQARNDIGEAHPGEHRIFFHKRLITRTRILSSKIPAGILQSMPAQQAEFRWAVGERTRTCGAAPKTRRSCRSCASSP